MVKLREENYPAALPLLETAVKEMPNNASAYCNMGVALWKMNRLDSAIKAFETATNLNGNDARPLEFLAQALIETGAIEEARKALTEAHERTPHSPRILTSLAVVEIQCGGKDLRYLTEALELKPSYAPALYNMALIYRDRADRQKCIKFCLAYLDSMDNQTRIANEQDNLRTELITELHLAMLNEDAASTQPFVKTPAEPPIKVPTKTINPILVQARKSIGNESYGTALVLLKQGIKKSPNNADLLWELAIVYDKHLRYIDSAMRTYNQFSKQFPNDPRIQDMPKYEKVKITPPTKKPPIAAVKPIKPSQPQYNAARLFANGLKAHKRGEFTEAANLYRRVLKLDKTHTIAAYNLGLIYYNSGKNTDKAKEAFLLVIDQKPNMAEARYMLRVVYKQLGDNNNAFEQLNKTLRIKPNHAKAHFVLSLIYNKEKQFGVARLHLKRYLQFAPKGTYAPQAKQLLNNIERELSGDAHKPPMPR